MIMDFLLLETIKKKKNLIFFFPTKKKKKLIIFTYYITATSSKLVGGYNLFTRQLTFSPTDSPVAGTFFKINKIK